MKYFKKNMHYLLVTLYLFSSQINAFSFDNHNELNIGIPISEKTYTNKTYENLENLESVYAFGFTPNSDITGIKMSSLSTAVSSNNNVFDNVTILKFDTAVSSDNF